MIKRTCSSLLVLLGLLAMVSIEPGQALWPYIAVMAAALAAVAAGAKMGGYWHKKEPQETAACMQRISRAAQRNK